MNIQKKRVVHPVNRRLTPVLRLSAEIEFWKAEYIELLKQFYPVSWKEEAWKASLRLIEKKVKP